MPNRTRNRKQAVVVEDTITVSEAVYDHQGSETFSENKVESTTPEPFNHEPESVSVKVGHRMPTPAVEYSSFVIEVTAKIHHEKGDSGMAIEVATEEAIAGLEAANNKFESRFPELFSGSEPQELEITNDAVDDEFGEFDENLS